MNFLAHFLPKRRPEKDKKSYQVRVVKVTGRKHTTYDVQIKKKFLWFEWWKTISDGHLDIRKARNIALKSLFKGKGFPDNRKET